jgi:hypothetical protein
MTIRELEKIIQGVPEQDKDKTINLWIYDRKEEWEADNIVLDKAVSREKNCRYYLGVGDIGLEDYEPNYAWDEKV